MACGGGSADSAIFRSGWFFRKIQFMKEKAYQSKAASIGTGRGIYRSIRSRIDTGALRPGERLPSTRALAADLGVSRSTVVAVYEQLASEGYIETAAGARARVSPGVGSRPGPGRQPAGRLPKRTPELSAYGEGIRRLALPQRPVAQCYHCAYVAPGATP